MTSIGVQRRLNRLFDSATGRTVMVPIDDSLIFGPTVGLERMDAALCEISRGEPNAILGFAGQFERHLEVLKEVPWVINLTASTVLSHHTKKQLIMSVREAIEYGCDAVAAHVNVTSNYEPDMLRSLCSVISDSRSHGVPVLAIMYPRGETAEGSDENYLAMRESTPMDYATMVAHAVRIAVDLGACIVKTHYTGTASSFARVVAAAGSVPVLISGGPLVDPLLALKTAADAVAAGGAGVSFGRNVFSRNEPWRMIRALKDVVLNEVVPDEAQSHYLPE